MIPSIRAESGCSGTDLQAYFPRYRRAVPKNRRTMKPLLLAILLGVPLFSAAVLPADESKPAPTQTSTPATGASEKVNFLLPDSADAAWTAVQKALRPPPPPAAHAGSARRRNGLCRSTPLRGG